MAVRLTNRRPMLLALAASFLLTVLIIVGSRNLEHYDAALFGYTVASVVAFGAVVFRYAMWLQRPATRVYWRRGWSLFRDRKNLVANTSSAAKTLVGGMAIQKFIGISRGHLKPFNPARKKLSTYWPLGKESNRTNAAKYLIRRTFWWSRWDRQKRKYLPFRKLQPPRDFKGFPFFPIPYHRVPVACSYFCPRIGHLELIDLDGL